MLPNILYTGKYPALLLTLVLAACSSSKSTIDPGPGNQNTLTDSPLLGAATPDLSIGCDASEQELQTAVLHLLNRYRSEGVYCGSEYYPAVDPLELNDQLLSAAVKHSLDMARLNFFSHTGSDGLTVSGRVTASGYNWRTVGENIAGGQQSVESVVTEWIESPGHCVNIMTAGFTETATACRINSESTLRLYWTSVFGAR